MNSNLVPKQIKNIHVVHDIINSGSKITYPLNLSFKPDIIEVNMISSDCDNIAAGNEELVKIVSNISNDTPVIGNAFYNNGLSIIRKQLVLTSSFVPNLLEFTVMNNEDLYVDVLGVNKAVFIYDISFIKY